MHESNTRKRMEDNEDIRYDAKCSLEEECEEVIRRVLLKRPVVCESSMRMQSLLEDNKGFLLRWSKQTEVDKGKVLREKTELLKQLQEDEGNHNIEEIKKTKKKELIKRLGLFLTRKI